jgi:hypothetical protein
LLLGNGVGKHPNLEFGRLEIPGTPVYCLYLAIGFI